MALERSEILAGIKSRFLIITLYVSWIEMLAADVSEFIEKPRRGSHFMLPTSVIFDDARAEPRIKKSRILFVAWILTP